MQVLPREVSSLYGAFPQELLPALEGFVPASDLEKARHRVPAEYAKLSRQALGGATEAQFRWAFSVRSPFMIILMGAIRG